MHDYQLLNQTLVIAALLFALGTTGILCRRDLVPVALAAGVILQGAILTLIAFSNFHGNRSGRVFALVALAVAAIQGTSALALMITGGRREVEPAIPEPGPQAVLAPTGAAPAPTGDGPDLHGDAPDPHGAADE